MLKFLGDWNIVFLALQVMVIVGSFTKATTLLFEFPDLIYRRITIVIIKKYYQSI